MGKFRTPIVSPLREKGSTFFTFPSAMEDIGLNINERNNKVYLSRYVLLNLPDISSKLMVNDDDDGNKYAKTISYEAFSPQGKYSTENDSVSYQAITKLKNDFDATNNNNKFSSVPTLLQNYAMNLETRLRNSGTYDYSSTNTVSERCFWKFLKHSGVFNVTKDSNGYYKEATTDPSKRVIKGYGAISSSSQSSNTFTINNETYIMIPSSYGQMDYVLKSHDDVNMSANTRIVLENPYNIEGYTKNTATSILDKTTSAYTFPLTDTVIEDKRQISSSYYYIDKDETLEFVFNEAELSTSLDIESTDAKLSYDGIGIEHSISDEYAFNTILVYYTIYDTLGNSIGTNLFGVLFLGADDILVKNDNNEDIGVLNIPSLTKTKSTEGVFGSSYSFRLNMQTATIYDPVDAPIYDYSTATPATLTDFNDVVSSLKNTVKILANNAQIIRAVYDDNQTMKSLIQQTVDKVNELGTYVTSIEQGNVKELKTDSINSVNYKLNGEDITDILKKIVEDYKNK